MPVYMYRGRVLRIDGLVAWDERCCCSSSASASSASGASYGTVDGGAVRECCLELTDTLLFASVTGTGCTFEDCIGTMDQSGLLPGDGEAGITQRWDPGSPIGCDAVDGFDYTEMVCQNGQYVLILTTCSVQNEPAFSYINLDVLSCDPVHLIGYGEIVNAPEALNPCCIEGNQYFFEVTE